MTKKDLLSEEIIKVGYFDISIWKDLVERIGGLFQLDQNTKKNLLNNNLAKLIGAIPFLSNCDEPLRVSISNLAITYLASHESGKDVFVHNFTDNQNLGKRLEPISNFPNGNKEIIERGMALLKAVMLSDHNLDREMDINNSKYNPLNSGIWNYKKEILQLKKIIESTNCPEMDQILSFDEAVAIFWEFP